jgi:hypothetical protein
MLKITLPNGVIIEGDTAELVPIISGIVSVQKEPEPEPVPVPVPVRAVRKVKSVVELPLADPDPIDSDYPHRYAPNGKRATVIGERGDQVLQAAKLLAEESRNRSNEFKSRQVLEMIDTNLNISTISSALQGLMHQGLVRRGGHHRLWYITEKGWNSYYRIGQPLTAKTVRRTT